MLKKLTACVTWLILFSLFVVCRAPLALAQEGITHFNSDITINQDTSIAITETIDYYTFASKHGIYRYIPVRYTRNGLNYTALIHNIKVTDDKGKKINFEESHGGGNVTLKIGDADVTFSGPKTYVISYTVDNAVQQPEDAPPELYWDITGEGWQIDIASTSATVHSPFTSITKVACYAGVFGGDNSLCTHQTNQKSQANFTYPETISYGDNLTVAIGLDPHGGLVFPTAAQLLLKQIRDNWRLLPLLIPGLLMLAWWWSRGRDMVFMSWNVFNNDENQPQITAPLWNLRSAPMVYEPLKELTPGEAGALHDERVDNEDIIAEIIDLARQKLLKIDQKETTTFFIKNTDYTFTKLKEAPANLPEHQKYLHTSLFKTGKVVKLSDLKGSFYTHMEKMKKLLFASLTKKQLFLANPETTRGTGLAAAIVMIVISAYWGINLLSLGMWWAVPCFIFSAVASFLAAYNLPSKSATGSNFAWQVRGLKESIARGAWREKIKEKHLFFEEVLPFAIALGVVDKLSKDMEKLNVKSPEYLSTTNLNAWSTSSFVNSFTSQASTNLSYNPSSSSYSSGSGFSGGSSGGGGGGGGGGSW